MVQKLKKRIKDQRGMTLVELLAVIVILGIISAIAVPNIGGIINKTKNDAKVAEAVQIINAAKLYETTHPIPVADTDQIVTLENNQLAAYLDNVKITTFQVVVDGTGSKYTYILKKHPGVLLAGGTEDDGVTETKLLEYNGN